VIASVRKCKKPGCEGEARGEMAYCSRSCSPLGNYGKPPRSRDAERRHTRYLREIARRTGAPIKKD